jgi:hypothetical protein
VGGKQLNRRQVTFAFFASLAVYTQSGAKGLKAIAAFCAKLVLVVRWAPRICLIANWHLKQQHSRKNFKRHTRKYTNSVLLVSNCKKKLRCFLNFLEFVFGLKIVALNIAHLITLHFALGAH